MDEATSVLILVLMEYALRCVLETLQHIMMVLILVLMEYALRDDMGRKFVHLNVGS